MVGVDVGCNVVVGVNVGEMVGKSLLSAAAAVAEKRKSVSERSFMAYRQSLCLQS